MQVYKSLQYYRHEGFSSWIKRIAVNKAIDYKRIKARAPNYTSMEYVDERAIQETEHVEAIVVRQERIQRVKEELNAIPESYQAIIQSFYIDEKTYAEISQELGVEIKTVESKLYRARKWLKQHWTREEF